MANEYTPSQVSAHIRKVWSKEIGLVASEEQIAVPLCAKLEKIEGELAFRKFGTLTTNSLSDSAVGSGLTVSGQSEIAISATPATRYVMVVVNFNTAARLAFDPKTPLREQMKAAMYEQVDRTVMSLATLLTTNIVGDATAEISDALMREVKRKLTLSAKSRFKPGKTGYAVVMHPSDIETLEGIEAYYKSADRGDGETPLPDGWMYKVRGATIYESGSVQVDTVTRNFAVIPNETWGIGYNQDYSAKMEEYELLWKLILWLDFGVLERWDEYGVAINTSPK